MRRDTKGDEKAAKTRHKTICAVNLTVPPKSDVSP
jgi:hypothetical protein